MKIIIPVVLFAAFLTSCATPSKVQCINLTNPRPKIQVSDVRISSTVPLGAVRMAHIISVAGDNEKGSEFAQKEIIRKAAEIGANFLQIDLDDSLFFHAPYPSFTTQDFRLEANAYYVPN